MVVRNDDLDYLIRFDSISDCVRPVSRRASYDKTDRDDQRGLDMFHVTRWSCRRFR